ncbi:MAG: RluA family pseudouridine synthase [Lachnospiraceae bacterium]|nr:RluA family pseudouridine synthase [Lachnospiraceae bacterium]
MREFVIGKNEAEQRFDKYLKKLLSEAGSGFIYKMLRKKNIVLNGKKSDGSEIIHIGDSVKVFLSDETFLKFSSDKSTNDRIIALPKWNSDNPPFDIIYEDKDILVVNKPSGMLTQKAKDNDVSCNEYILAYLLKEGCITTESMKTFRPSVLNRLDRNTSGIVIAGKTLSGSQNMSKALNERSIHKYYKAVVYGVVEDETKVEAYLYHDEKTNKVTLSDKMSDGAKKIVTSYRPISVAGNVTLLEIELITGRTHQIRAHLAYMNHPIIGDFKYGIDSVNRMARDKYKIKSQMLHSYKLEFEDKKTIVCEPPDIFMKVKL